MGAILVKDLQLYIYCLVGLLLEVLLLNRVLTLAVKFPYDGVDEGVLWSNVSTPDWHLDNLFFTGIVSITLIRLLRQPLTAHCTLYSRVAYSFRRPVIPV